jgi:hypothetical protein
MTSLRLACFVGVTVSLIHTVGCSSKGATASTATIDTLPNGTVLVQNGREGAWSHTAAWSIEEVVRIGSAMGEDTLATFGDIWAVTLDRLGRIYVLDRQPKQLRVFDSAGQIVRVLGREGSGPGEFINPIGMDWDREGNLWIVDPRNARYTVYDTAGTLVASHRRRIGSWGFPWGGGFSRVGELFEPTFYQDPTSGESRRGYVRHLVDDGVTPIDTVRLPSYEGGSFTVESVGRRAVLGIPFAPTLPWQFDGRDGLWFGVSDEYRLYHRTLSGDTLRIVSREYQPVPVTAEDRETIRKSFGNTPFMSEAHINSLLDRVPDVKSAFDRLIVDDRGYLWISRQTSSGPEVDVFDAEGVYLGSLTIDINFAPPPAVIGNHIVGVWRDGMGVQFVLLYRIVGREP